MARTASDYAQWFPDTMPMLLNDDFKTSLMSPGPADGAGMTAASAAALELNPFALAMDQARYWATSNAQTVNLAMLINSPSPLPLSYLDGLHRHARQPTLYPQQQQQQLQQPQQQGSAAVQQPQDGGNGGPGANAGDATAGMAMDGHDYQDKAVHGSIRPAADFSDGDSPSASVPTQFDGVKAQQVPTLYGGAPTGPGGASGLANASSAGAGVAPNGSSAAATVPTMSPRREAAVRRVVAAPLLFDDLAVDTRLSAVGRHHSSHHSGSIGLMHSSSTEFPSSSGSASGSGTDDEDEDSSYRDPDYVEYTGTGTGTGAGSNGASHGHHAGTGGKGRASHSRAGKSSAGPRNSDDSTSASSGAPTSLASRRQERNRVAARRSREKKKEYVQELEATAHALVIKNKDLLKDIRKLRKELNELKGIPSFDSADDGGQGKTALTRRGIPARSAAVAAAATTTLTSAALAGINTASIHSGPAVGGGSRAFRA